jgi:hypothetical protein
MPTRLLSVNAHPSNAAMIGKTWVDRGVAKYPWRKFEQSITENSTLLRAYTELGSVGDDGNVAVPAAEHEHTGCTRSLLSSTGTAGRFRRRGVVAELRSFIEPLIVARLRAFALARSRLCSLRRRSSARLSESSIVNSVEFCVSGGWADGRSGFVGTAAMAG